MRKDDQRNQAQRDDVSSVHFSSNFFRTSSQASTSLWMEHLGVAAKPYKHHAKKVTCCETNLPCSTAYSGIQYTSYTVDRIRRYLKSHCCKDMLAIVGLKLVQLANPMAAFFYDNFSWSISSIYPYYEPVNLPDSSPIYVRSDRS